MPEPQRHDLREPSGHAARQPDAHREAGEAASEAERIRLKRQRVRSLALAWGLAALAVLFFVVTLVRLGGNVLNRPL